MKFEEALELFGLPHFLLDEDYSLDDLIKIYHKNILFIYEQDFTDISGQIKK